MIHAINVRRVLFLSMFGFLLVSLLAMTANAQSITLPVQTITGDKNASVDSLILLEADLIELEGDIESVAPPFKSTRQRADYYKTKMAFEKKRQQYASLAARLAPSDDERVTWNRTAWHSRRKQAEYDRKLCSAVYDLQQGE